MKNIQNKVAYYRKKNNMTQQQLAEKIGIWRTTLSKIENGHIIPSIKLILKIADYYNLSPGDIFFIEYEESNEI